MVGHAAWIWFCCVLIGYLNRLEKFKICIRKKEKPEIDLNVLIFCSHHSIFFLVKWYSGLFLPVKALLNSMQLSMNITFLDSFLLCSWTRISDSLIAEHGCDLSPLCCLLYMSFIWDVMHFRSVPPYKSMKMQWPWKTRLRQFRGPSSYSLLMNFFLYFKHITYCYWYHALVGHPNNILSAVQLLGRYILIDWRERVPPTKYISSKVTS